MRVFISSVRRGLEKERDSLQGLIGALGHEPSRFEDFGARPEPSREACMRGVAEADVYLLLLGPNYGHVFPETGQSATHDEFMAARAAGIPRLIFRKTGVVFEPEQEVFTAQVGDYGTGGFYAEFADASDLQVKVVQAIRAQEAQPGPLLYQPLPGPITVAYDERSDRYITDGEVSSLDVHVVGLGQPAHPARVMGTLPDRIVSSLRSAGAVAPSVGLTPVLTGGVARVDLPPPVRQRFDESSPTTLRHVAVRSSGQVTVRHSLPRDSMGAILDETDLASTVAASLRIVGALRLLTGDLLAVAADITGGGMLSEGSVQAESRSRASIGFGQQGPRAVPDEGVTLAALDIGADEVARDIAIALIRTYRAANH